MRAIRPIGSCWATRSRPLIQALRIGVSITAGAADKQAFCARNRRPIAALPPAGSPGRYKHARPDLQSHFPGGFPHAALRPRARRAARRVASSAASPNTPKAPASSTSATPRCCAPRPSRNGCRPGCGPGPGLGHRRIRHAAARHPRAHPPRGHRRQAVRPHAGNPAPDRPLAARRRRPAGARRAPDHASIAT